VMSTDPRIQLTHMLDGLGAIVMPQEQHNLVGCMLRSDLKMCDDRHRETYILASVSSGV
jgi:hypothetical protein